MIEVLQFVGAIAGLWVLGRQLVLERSKLLVTQKLDPTQESFVRLTYSRTEHTEQGSTTLLIANKSSRANAILQYQGWVEDIQGTKVPLDLTEGFLRSSRGDSPEIAFNVAPLSLPPFTSVQAHIVFSVSASRLPNPAVFEFRLVDMYGKVYKINIRIPNVVKATLSE
jgi:hypothetical protein